MILTTPTKQPYTTTKHNNKSYIFTLYLFMLLCVVGNCLLFYCSCTGNCENCCWINGNASVSGRIKDKIDNKIGNKIGNNIKDNKVKENKEEKKIENKEEKKEEKKKEEGKVENKIKIENEKKINKNEIKINKNEIISLGINIGASKTVYSIFSKVNGQFISHVLLMNNSSRVIPSILCYTTTHRLFGENSLTSLKQNLNTSHNNLSRIIGFKNDITIYKEEPKYQLSKYNNMEDHKFFLKKQEEFKEIGSDIILSDFIYLINKYYFTKEKYEYTSTYISVPDFFTSYQKQQVEIIFNALKMKDVHILNESSAITMYYGYSKYADNFVQTKKVDSTIEKYILFIDSGYSKTSFILSYFKYNLFKVIYVTCIPDIGGRNFDKKIMDYCIDKFLIQGNIKKEDFDLTDRMEYRLLEDIKKKRIQLSVNTDTTISVDAFYNDTDLSITITRDKFVELIEDDLKKINNTFDEIIKYSNNNKIKIDCVEIAGELMRTPSLQKMIEKENLKISKSLLTDECTSVGAALIGNYIKRKFPIASYKLFYHYNYYKIMYQISFDINSKNDQKNLLMDIGTIESDNNKKSIILNKDFVKENKPIYIKIFYDNENNNVELFTKNLNLKILKIELHKILNGNGIDTNTIKDKDLVLQITFDPSQYSMTEELFLNEKKLKAQIEYMEDSIYKSKKQKEEEMKNIREQLKINENYDKQYDDYTESKTKISNYGYAIKELIKDDEKFSDEFKAYQEFDRYMRKECEDKLLLEPCEERLKSIVFFIINKYLNYYKNGTQVDIKIQEKLKGKEQKLLDMQKGINDKVENVNVKEFVDLLNEEDP